MTLNTRTSGLDTLWNIQRATSFEFLVRLSASHDCKVSRDKQKLPLGLEFTLCVTVRNAQASTVVCVKLTTPETRGDIQRMESGPKSCHLVD